VDKVVRDGEQHSVLRTRFHILQHEVETKHQLKSVKAKISRRLSFLRSMSQIGDEVGMNVNDL